MSKIKNGWLDLYGTEPFEQQQFGPAGAEGVCVHLSTFVDGLSQIYVDFYQINYRKSFFHGLSEFN